MQRATCVDRPDVGHAIQDFVSRCFDVTNRHFSLVFVVQPAIPIVDDEKSAPGEAAFMEHMNALVLGMCSSELYQGVHYYLPRKIVDRQQRVTALANSIAQSVNLSRERATQLQESGVAFH